MLAARNISLIAVHRAVKENNDAGGQVALGLSYFLTFVSTLLVILRFWSRKISRFGIGLDDWLALVTLILLYLVVALSVVLVYDEGVGESLAQATREQSSSPVNSLKLLYALEWVYLFASPIMKLSVLAYCLRIFPTAMMKRYIWILTGVCGAWFVEVLIGNLVECQPISYFWTKLSAPGTGVCHFRVDVYLIIIAAPNIVIDVLTVILPLYEVWQLQLERWKRIAVSGIFVVGGMVVIVSIVRLALLVGFYFKHSVYQTNNILLPWFLTVAEIGVGIVGACLPCLMPLYRRFWHDKISTSAKASVYGAQSSLRSHMPVGSNTVIAGSSGGTKTLADPGDAERPFERLSTLRNSHGDNIPLGGIIVRHEITIQH